MMYDFQSVLDQYTSKDNPKIHGVLAKCVDGTGGKCFRSLFEDQQLTRVSGQASQDARMLYVYRPVSPSAGKAGLDMWAFAVMSTTTLNHMVQYGTDTGTSLLKTRLCHVVCLLGVIVVINHSLLSPCVGSCYEKETVKE